MSLTLRQWGTLSVGIAGIMVLTSLMILPTASASSGPTAFQIAQSQVTAGSLPAFPTNLTHFVYIVRENHVFDDYLGDCSIDINDTCNGGSSYNSTTSATKTETKASGDQLLTPYLHDLARNYTVFDNMYSGVDPYSAQAHAFLFAANSWGSSDSCASGGAEGTGSTTEWGIYNNSNVKSGSCGYAADSASQTYDSTGGSIFDRFLGPDVAQSSTTIPFLEDGDIIWELTSDSSCSVASTTGIPGSLTGDSEAVEHITGCTNGWWLNTTSGQPDMPPTDNSVTGIPQELWACEYACTAGPQPNLDSYEANAFVSYLADYGLPTYTFIELFNDHPGNNCEITQATCIKDNDAAMNEIVSAVENNTAYKNNTVIAITEDDTQDGQNDLDHVNSGRRFPFVLVAPHSVEKRGGAPSTCGIATTYSSCGYVVHETYNTSNVIAAMERVEMNVNPNVFYSGGIAPTSAQFPMIENDYLAEGNPLSAVWLCAGSHAAYCNTGVAVSQTLASTSFTPNPVNDATSTAITLTASALNTKGAGISTGVTYNWTISSAKLGSIAPISGSSVTYTSGSSAATGTICENATYSGVTKQACAPVNVSAGVTLASVTVLPTSTSINPNGTVSLTVTSMGSNSQSLTSLTSFAWTEKPTTLGSLNVSTGTAVTFTGGTSTGNTTVCVNGTYKSTTKGSCSLIDITSVPPTLTTVTLSSVPAIIGERANVSITAQAYDQYGNALKTGITYSWSVLSSVGTLNSTSGATVTFSAGTTPGASGPISVTATQGANAPKSTQALVTIFGVTTTASTTSGTAPLSVTFSAVPAGGQAPYSYNWTFGDGNFSTSASPTHSYCKAGSYVPKVIVSDSGGHTATNYTQTISVASSCSGTTKPVTSSATGAPLTGTVPLTVSFTGDAQGGAGTYNFSWVFGNGNTGYGQTIIETYTTTGTFKATLFVNDSSGSSAKPYSLTVNVNPVTTSPVSVAAVDSPSSGQSPLTVTFDASASGGSGTYTSYSWTFGDGTTGTGAQASHTYTNKGTSNEVFPVTVTVKDSNGNVGNGYLNVTVTPGSTTPPPTNNTTPAATPWLDYALIGLVAVLAIAVAALALRKPKHKEPTDQGEGGYQYASNPYDSGYAPPPSQ